MFSFKKKLLSSLLAVVMVFTLIPAGEVTNPVKEVYAAADTSQYADSYIVNANIIPDTVLFNALTNLLGSGFTVGELKNYEGAIDLSAYPTIQSVVGLGYARKATSIDLSALTKVYRIEEKEFLSCSFSTFKLPKNIEKIGKEAFEYCANLTTIEFPETLKSIDQLAFNECVRLDNIELPAGLEKIGTSAFQACTALKAIVIPDGLNAMAENSTTDADTGIGAQVFMGCVSLASVKLGNGMTAIPSGFLQGTTSLTQIDIPSKIMNIRDNAFAYTGLTSIDLSANTSMTVINKSVFAGSSNLATAKLPTSIVKIDDSAFSGCSLINSSEIPNLPNLEYIGANAFANCLFISITIGGKVTTIGDYAFHTNIVLMKVVFDDYPEEPTSSKVKTIGKNAFNNCVYLQDVVLPTKYEKNINATIRIKDNAFSSCIRLKNINFPENVVEIGNRAFLGCAYAGNRYTDGLQCETASTRYVLKSQVSATDNGGEKYEFFSNDDERFYMFGEYYINGSMYEQSTDVPGGDEYIRIYVNLIPDDYATKETDGQERFILKEQYFTGLTNVDLSKCTKLSLGTNVFMECVNLDTVILPNTITVIPDGTFQNCAVPMYTASGESKEIRYFKNPAQGFDWYHGLRTVKMSKNVTEIGESAFRNCFNFKLTDDLPEDLVTIGAYAFANAESIGNITLPSKLVTIGKAAFSGCSRIIEGQVIRGYGMVILDAREANSLTTIGEQAFKNCAFTQFLMNDNAPITKIEKNVFENCQFLTSVRVSDAVKYIGKNAFAGCTRLMTVSVPDICTFDAGALLGAVELKPEYIFYDDMNVIALGDVSLNDLSYYLIANSFGLTIRPTVEKTVVLVNGEAILPVVTPVANGACQISKVKVGDVEYEFDENMQLITTVPADATIIPSIVVVDNTVAALAVKLEGVSEVSDVQVQVQMNLQYSTYSEDTVTITLAPQVAYNVSVTDNTCTAINVDDMHYVSYTKTTNTTIAPEFDAIVDDMPISDEVKWTVVSGADLITLTPSEDGLSATYKPTKTGYGTATVEINAGAVTKTIYIDIVAPSNGVNVTPTKLDMMISTEKQITAAITYSSSYSDVKEQYPDELAFTSSAPNIVKIDDIVTIDGKTFCTLKALAIGTATITVKTLGSSKTKTISVNVTASDLETTVFDSMGNVVENGQVVEVVGKNGKNFTYELNKNLNNPAVVVESSNSNIVEAKFNSLTDTIDVKGKGVGRATVYVYPEVGDKTQNGTSFVVKVDGDITYITLSKKTIELGSTASVFGGMKNEFGQETTNIANVASISSNVIKFTSSAPQYVSVDSKGNAKVLKLSNPIEPVTITCTAYRDDVAVKTVTTIVTPTKQDVKSISYSGSTAVYVGKSTTINLSYAPSNAKYKSYRASYGTGAMSYVSMSFDSSTQKLVVKGKKAGTAQIVVTITTTTGKVTKTITITVLPDLSGKKVELGTPVAKKKKVKITWKKIDGATGYEVAMSKKKKKGYTTVKTIKKGTKVKYTKKKLSRKTKYFFKVRAFAKTAYGTKYSKWSKPKKVKTK